MPMPKPNPISGHQAALMSMREYLNGRAPSDHQATRAVLLSLLGHLIDQEERAYEMLVKPREKPNGEPT